jgi:O-antigen/teichoic acid export membrane protein
MPSKSSNSIVGGMLLVTVGSIVSTFFSYYFNFYIQSIFPNLGDYGNFVFVLTFLTLTQLIPLSVSSSLSILVTELKVKNEFKKLTMLYLKMNLLFGCIGALMGVASVSFSSQISQIFKVGDVLYIQLLALLILVSTLSIPVTSYLYGLLRFKSHTSLIVMISILKLVFVYSFFISGFGFLSVLYGLILSSVSLIIVGNILLLSSFDKEYKNSDITGLTKKVLFFSLPIFFISTGNGLISQIDFLLIKSKFAPDMSGQYGLLVNIGKIFYFSSIIFLGAMSPQITEAYNKRDGYFKILFFYLKIVSAIVLGGLAIFGLFPKWFLDIFIFLSSKIGLNLSSLNLYYQITWLIPGYSIFIALVILINFLVLFLIATSTTRIYLGFIFASLFQFLLIYFYSFDLYSVIICNIISASVLLGYLIYETYRKYESFHNRSGL